MEGLIFAVSGNALAFVGLLITFIYRQGKTDGKLEQIDKRMDRYERNLNNKGE